MHKSQISDVEKNFRETNKASKPSETASRELRSRHWSSERRKKGLQEKHFETIMPENVLDLMKSINFWSEGLHHTLDRISSEDTIAGSL